jgi:hypothetical protein
MASPLTPQRSFWTERRANLVFISALLLLTMPGMVMLVVKKLSKPPSGAPPMMNPVRGQLAYMDTTMGSYVDRRARFVPPMTRDFVSAYAARQKFYHPGLVSIVESPDWKPVMSDDLSTQVLARDTTPGNQAVMLLCWDAQAKPIIENWSFLGRAGDREVAGVVSGIESYNLPLDVRRELRSSGFVLPPASVIWLLVTFDAAEPVHEVSLRYSGLTDTIATRINFPRVGQSTAAE